METTLPRVQTASRPSPLLRVAACLSTCIGACASVSGIDTDHWMGAWSRRMLRHLHVEVEIRNELPKWPRLWIANHLSWLDPLVLMSLRPSKAMAKAEVRDYPLIGRGAKKAGLVFVQREDPLSRAAAVARLTQALRNDMGIIVFPEGTTTNGQDLAPLQEGSLRAAYRLETDLLPIRLSSSSDHYPWVGDAKLLPHLWTLASAERTVVRAEGRKVLHPWNFKTEERWLDAVRESLMP